ncbi:MAG: excinuclease subunit [Candidatus Peribacteria bacterium]|nr:excinuclease subunit [Candidatus Peribacteria bacterium]
MRRQRHWKGSELSSEQERIPIVFGEHMARLKDRVRQVPTDPGVYRWLDRTGRILYIGKAKNLRNRMRSYVTGSHKDEGVFKRSMWDEMWDFEVTVTNTELEALILEMHLIRSQKPLYNVALTRDRHYVYVRVGRTELYPNVTIVGKRGMDDAAYFGPFVDPYGQERMLELLRSIFPFRTCGMGIGMKNPGLFDLETGETGDTRETGDLKSRVALDVVLTKPDRKIPCFDFHIRRCSAPCEGLISPAEYQEECIDGVMEFYGGQFGKVVDRLIDRMKASRGERKYQRALEILRALQFIRSMQKQHLMIGMAGMTADAIGVVCMKRTVQIAVLQIRGGNIVNEVAVKIRGTEATMHDVLQTFLAEYYSQVSAVPDVLLMEHDLPQMDVIRQVLNAGREKPVKIEKPKKKSEKARLLELAKDNALKKLEAERIKRSVVQKHGALRGIPSMSD